MNPLMNSELLLKIILIAYFLAGYNNVIKASLADPLNTPAFMLKPNILKKILWALIWPVNAFLEAYFIHMPNKARAIVYGIVTVPVLWFGFTIFAGIIVYPNFVIENNLFAMLASVAVFVVGSILIMPIISILCGKLTWLLAAPFVLFLPKN